MRLSLGRNHETGWRFALVVAGVFAALQIVGHVHHELWRDELESFGTARHALGLWDILTGSRRYAGHPFLWYYVLYLVATIDRSYLGLHVVTWSLSVAAALLWLRYAPVPRLLRVATLGSYYLVYEYGVICRGYTLGVFLTFAICAAYRREQVRYLPLALLIVLLAATSVYGLAVAVALAVFIFARGPALDAAAAPLPARRVSLPLAWIGGVAIIVLGFAAVAMTTVPPSDALYQSPHVSAPTGGTMLNAAAQYWRGMFPFKGVLDWSWTGNDYLGSRSSALRPLIPWFGAAWLAGCVFALRRSPRAAVAYVVGALLIASIEVIVYSAVGWRHIGHHFVLLVACVWLHARDHARPPRARTLHAMLLATAGVQIFAAAGALATDYRGKFSTAVDLVQYIKEHHLENVPVVADDDVTVFPIAVMLDRPFLYPVTGAFGQVPVFHNHRTAVANDALVSDADRVAREWGGQALLILSSNHGELDPSPRGPKLMGTTGPSIVGDESYRLYEVRSQ